jgi:predicted nucleotidyltransferase
MFDTDRYPTLTYAHNWSNEMLEQMRQRLAPLVESAPDVSIAAVSGSLGRLEGMAHSDCDLIVLVNDDAIHDPVRCQKAMQAVWDALDPLGLPLPKSTGIYVTPSSYSQICDYNSLGLIADDKNIFGKRMQVLLDAKPIYGEEHFQKLISGLLERYAAGFLIYDQKKEWVYLLNDLIRYFRSYCAWHQFDLSNDPIDSWHMRNTKLRNSRIPMFAALIFLLGECSKEKKDKINWMREHLLLTPMQRIEKVYILNNDGGFNILLDAENEFT